MTRSVRLDLKDIKGRRRCFNGLIVVVLVISICVIAPGCGQRHGVTPALDFAPKKASGIEPRALNIVLITLDTLRSDRLSCYGSDLVSTPNIDGFANEGVLFRNAVSTVPFTLPAHASILTGLYPPGHGIRENVGYSLNENAPTVAELLSAEGWSTAGFVSTFVLDRRWGVGRGFDHYFDDFNVTSIELPNMNSVQRTGDVTIKEVVSWLDRRPTDQPFFLWLHLYDPHDPYEPPEPYRSMYEGRPYDGEVAFTDALIGDFRQALEDRELIEDTLVVLTADHGEGLGDHGEPFHGFFLYDATIHVPLIMRLPSSFAAGSEVDVAVSHVDLLPTILEVAGLKQPAGLHGQSLIPFIKGEAVAPGRAVYAESLYPFFHYGFSPLRALRTEEFKLISAPRPELFEVTTDSSEEIDLARQRPEVLRDLKRRLDELEPTLGTADQGADSMNLDPVAIAQLQALGYTGGRGAFSLNQEADRPRADPKDKIGVHRLIMRAQSQLRSEQETARKTLLRVLEHDDEIFDAHLMLGQIAATEQDFTQALARFEKALELLPDHSDALMGLAGAYRFLGRYEPALFYLHRLLEVSGPNTGASLAVADIEFERGRPAAAAQVLERALMTCETPSILHNKLGEIRLEQGRVSEALLLFKTAVEEDTTRARPNFNLATVYEELGDAQSAVAHYEKAIELKPGYLEAQFNLGRLMGRLGRVDRQQELWEAAVEAHPEFVQGNYYLAKLMMDRGRDLEKAEVLVRRGIASDPTNEAGPLGYYLLADILNRTGRSSEASVVFAQGRKIQDEMM